MAVSGSTSNYGFLKPTFTADFWHEGYWDNLDRIDALLFAIAGDLDNIVANWANATVYAVGDRVIDTADATAWQCVVGNTSGANPQTMAQYRAANPTHWASLASTLAIRGAWAQNTQYNVNDVAYQTAQHLYGICVTAHTSTGAGTMRTDAVKWAFMADLLPDVTATAADVVAAAASAAAAAASAAGLTAVFSAQGDIVYRNATVAARLAAGTAGYVLTTQGAGQNPSWSYGPAMVLLDSGDFTLAANKEWALDGYTGYKSFRLVLHHMSPATDSVSLNMLFSTDGGATFITTATYDQTLQQVDAAAAFTSIGNDNVTEWTLSDTIGNLAAEGVSGYIDIFRPALATIRPRVMGDLMWISEAGVLTQGKTTGTNNNAADITDIRLLFTAGNIAAVGSWSLYGLR